ncbi:hypothetical protein HHK36_025342 [Tetracentron sinense]|uniref:RING-type E3 ubiquitin transferase n=1 Tax=Tetracentron sinense TaxID=13715 RepID=A0A834YH97_TETSI|nr:hypothetical protein HHK36_025342 [Tetracentron sinense]
MGNPSDHDRTASLDDSAAVAVTGKIMVAAIIILFLVVVLVLFLHLYAKWFWGRRPDSPNANGRRRLVFAPSQDPVFAQRRGLEPSLIRSLPVLIFNPQDFKDGLECAVCLSELSQGEKARLLPKCNHGFHLDCIDMWFQSHSTCPLCRNPVGPPQSSNSLPDDIQTPVDDSPIESPNFPTNVLFWGNQTQVSTRLSGLEEAHSSSPRSSTLNSRRPDGVLVIDIPQNLTEGSSSRFAEEDMRSPMATGLRSLKRLLSRVDPYSPRSVDVEYGEVVRGQSSKTAADS